VSLESFLESDFTGARDFESFLGTRICFNLWHLLMRFFMIPCWRICTGRTLMEPFGQSYPALKQEDHLKMERKSTVIFAKMEIIY
jgi:hypothetical protein